MINENYLKKLADMQTQIKEPVPKKENGERRINDLIRRNAVIDAINSLDIPEDTCVFEILSHIALAIGTLPSAQPEYEPVTAEYFAKTMSENSLYNFVTWHQEALTLMKEQGFVICKKTM